MDREAAVELEVAPAPCPTLTLNVVLREDGDRSQSGWNGTLLVRDAQGQLILRTQLDHQFHGHWQAQLPFRLGLPAGSYDLELRSWHQAISLGRAVVGESGGTAELRVP